MKRLIIIIMTVVLLPLATFARGEMRDGAEALAGKSMDRSVAGRSARRASDGEVKGKVVDAQGEPVAFANVVLLSGRDSAVVAGVMTAEDGTFEIAASAVNGAGIGSGSGTGAGLTGCDGRLLMVSMVGYKTRCIDLDGDPASLLIALEADAAFLEGAQVSAVLPKTQLTGEGLQTSVHGTTLETVGTANDVLARTPGLIKSQDGLQVVGKGTPVIYINGRKVVDSHELDRLQSREIQSVEVITNPGAQYNASVRSVIRIRTIRHMGDGFSFNATLADEQCVRHGCNDPSADYQMNIRHNGLDVFAGLSGLKYTIRQESDMLQQTFGAPAGSTSTGASTSAPAGAIAPASSTPGSISTPGTSTGTPGFRQEGTLDFEEQMIHTGINGGFNLQLSDNHSLGVRVESTFNPREDVRQSIDEDIFRGSELIDRLVSEGSHHIDKLPYGLNANAYYNGRAGKLGIDFNTDFYGMRASQNANTVESSAMGQDDDVRYISHSDSKMIASKLVLSYPIWQGMLQAGTEDVWSRKDDDYQISSSAVPSSASLLREDNLALFASYGCYVQKVGQFSAGLRYEHVDYSYDDLLGSEDLDRSYDNVFPTFAYANAFGPVQVQLSYGAKTYRPDFNSLSSSVRYHSRYIYQSGNARLQPQTNHDLGLNLNWKWLTMVSQYSRVEDAISHWSELYNSEGVVLVRPINLDRPMRSLVFLLNAAPTVGVWSINYTAGVQQQWLSLDMPDVREASGRREVSFNDKPMLFAKLFNTFSLKHGWRLELGGEYHSKGYSQNAYICRDYLDLTAAVQKSFLDNALVVRLEGADIAGLARYDVMTDCGSHMIRQTNRMDTQRIKLSVRYSFNTAQSKYKGTGAGSDVRSRMK